ncbi:MAG: polyprenyl diphosphate synthase, partial [Terriglobia bacterium]
PSQCVERGVRLSIIGRRDRLPRRLPAAIEAAEAATRGGRALHLRIAVDYSSRNAIVAAAQRWNGTPEISRERFARLLGAATHADGPVPDVDLLVRTGGEQRLSDFLLWGCAYAELYFTRRLWPDFAAADLEAAVKEFRGRQRRFGALPQAAAG